MITEHQRTAGIVIIIILFLLPSLFGQAQSNDSLFVEDMREEGIQFTQDNSIKLLMSGKEKFADMFEAIRQAKSSVHLEYFNFRNDSIAGLLFDILREKRKEGVEVRALFDGFGNDSNNRPLKKNISRNSMLTVSISTNSTLSAFPGSTISGPAIIVRLL